MRVGGLARFMPGVSSLRHYQRAWLRGDVIAGVTVAAYLVPQVMAYSEVAGLAPVAGPWAIMGSLLVYSVFGSGCCALSAGPGGWVSSPTCCRAQCSSGTWRASR